MSGSDDRQRRFWIGDSEAAPEPSSGPAASSGERLLRVAEWVVLAAGLALFGVLLARLGVASVFANVRAVGWGIALIIAVEILAYGANTLGWRAVFPRGGGAPPLRRLLGARIAGDAANYLTPTASLGGEFVRVRMLGGQAPTASIVASVMVAKLTQTVGLVAFLAGGFLAVVDGTRLPPSARWGLLAGMIAFATVLGALLIAQRRGLLVPALRLATRWRALRFLALLERPLEQIDAEMARVHAESTGRVVLSAANYAPFGGSFHCATLDIRRRGELQSYF